MANQRMTIGQFIQLRTANPDTDHDPYDPLRESLIELNTPSLGLNLSQPGPVPPPPPVTLSSPTTLPNPPNVSLSQPGVLPVPPAVTVSSPMILPPPPDVHLSDPLNLPPPPSVTLSQPGPEGASPNISISLPTPLPPPPPVMNTYVHPEKAFKPVVLSKPAPEAPLHKVKNNHSREPAPAPVPTQYSYNTPPPPNFHAAHPVVDPNSGYLRQFGDTYSVIGTDEGALADEPVMLERHLERMKRLGPAKLAVHTAQQGLLFAMNNNGKIWNPALMIPSVMSDFITPAIDTVPYDSQVALLNDSNPFHPTVMSRTMELERLEENYNRPSAGPMEDYSLSADARQQFSMRELIDDALSMKDPQILVKQYEGPSTFPQSKNLVEFAQLFKLDKAGINIAKRNDVVTNRSTATDPLVASAFADGIIPAKFAGDNDQGYILVGGGTRPDDVISDDEAFVPMSFMDLRPIIGGQFRCIYFRPFITSLEESLSPNYNEESYFGRTDPVVTYMSTTRNISLGFKIAAFAPEDLAPIYQKLYLLSSMVYPSYDHNMALRSGPVVRMRVGDVINADGPEGGRGLPGIIKDLRFSYSEAPWELRKGSKVPRHIDVSLSFTVLHDKPIGVYTDGAFGGITIRQGPSERMTAKNNLGTTVFNTSRTVVETNSNAFRDLSIASFADKDTVIDTETKFIEAKAAAPSTQKAKSRNNKTAKQKVIEPKRVYTGTAEFNGLGGLNTRAGGTLKDQRAIDRTSGGFSDTISTVIKPIIR